MYACHAECWPEHRAHSLSELVTRKGDGEDAVMSDAQQDTDTREYPCLIRATDGRQVQFSTLVVAIKTIITHLELMFVSVPG
jgi:hypothetical protein